MAHPDDLEEEVVVKFSDTLGHDEWFTEQLGELLSGNDARLPDGTIVMGALDFNEAASVLFANECDKKGI